MGTEVPDSFHAYDGVDLYRYIPVYAPVEGDSVLDVIRNLQARTVGEQIGWRKEHVSVGPTCACHGRRKIGVYENVSYHADGCGRPLGQPDETPEERQARWASIQQSPDDEYLNGYYPTIPGNDVAHIDLRYDAPGGIKNDAGEFVGNKSSKFNPFKGGDTIYSMHPDPETGKYEPIRGGKEIRGGRSEYREETKKHGLVEYAPGTTAHLEKLATERKAKKNETMRAGIEKYVKNHLPLGKIGEL
jgi:hypothetical protein